MKIATFRIFPAIFLFIGVFAAAKVQAKPYETIENLSKAYVVESDAFNKYGKYAEQADIDGYPMIAKLFRAAAFSEVIHSRNHAAAIEGLGGKIQKFALKAVKVGTTHENLESSAKDERRDESEMYSSFGAQAEKEGLREAKTSFKFASDSEVQHRLLFTKGLLVLGPKNVDYFVDVKSGETVEVAPGKSPPKSKLVDGAYVKAG